MLIRVIKALPLCLKAPKTALARVRDVSFQADNVSDVIVGLNNPSENKTLCVRRNKSHLNRGHHSSSIFKAKARKQLNSQKIKMYQPAA